MVLCEQQRTIASLLLKDSEHRLAAVLLQLSRKLGKRRGPGVQLQERITQEDLSGMVGTTRSRVGYFLRRFHNAGLVERLPGSFLMLYEQRLATYLDGVPDGSACSGRDRRAAVHGDARSRAIA